MRTIDASMLSGCELTPRYRRSAFLFPPIYSGDSGCPASADTFPPDSCSITSMLAVCKLYTQREGRVPVGTRPLKEQEQ